MEQQKLKVQKRTATGRGACRRLRKEGFVPGIIYGHKEENQQVQISVSDLDAVLRAGTRMVDLSFNGGSQKVLMKEVQFDTFGKELLHVDFNRVAMDEKISLSVEIRLKGTPAGAKEGGVLEQTLRELEIECLPGQIPDFVQVDTSEMVIGDVLRVGDISMPNGVTSLSDPDTTVAAVHHAHEEAVAEEEEGAAEPEMIGGKPTDGEEEPAEEAGDKKDKKQEEQEKQ